MRYLILIAALANCTPADIVPATDAPIAARTVQPIEPEERIGAFFETQCLDTTEAIHPFTRIGEQGEMFFLSRQNMNPTEYLESIGLTANDVTVTAITEESNYEYILAYAEFYGPNDGNHHAPGTIYNVYQSPNSYIIMPANEDIANQMHNHAQCSNPDEWQGITPLF